VELKNNAPDSHLLGTLSVTHHPCQQKEHEISFCLTRGADRVTAMEFDLCVGALCESNIQNSTDNKNKFMIFNI
jgi:hypothetical protein